LLIVYKERLASVKEIKAMTDFGVRLQKLMDKKYHGKALQPVE
jgi:hypothetical protein